MFPSYRHVILTYEFPLLPESFKKLAERNLQAELMDDPALPQDQHDQALRGLTTIHRFSGLVNRFWRPIRDSIAQIEQSASNEPPLTLMDVGCGDGYLLRQIGKKARAAGIDLRLVGVDFSAAALELAAAKAKTDGVDVQFQQVDVLKQDLPKADFVTNSLFLHHFESAQIVQTLAKFKAATRKKMIVEDLRRTATGYVLCYVASHLLTRSPIVHYDGMRSVEGALKINEVKQLLQDAELDDAVIDRHWPERFVIRWSR